MCLYPKIILNKKFSSNKQNRGIIPECKDERTKYVPVGCGKCMECMKQKARNWQVRLLEEIKNDQEGIFVTLTYSNDSIRELQKYCTMSGYNRDNELAGKSVRLFLERFRKHNKRSIKHWLVTELGHQGTENIHLHGILFGINPNDIDKYWQYGYVFKGTYVNAKTVNYIIKYVTKTDKDHKEYTQKVFCSKGIGANYFNRKDYYLNKFNGINTNELYKNAQGYKMNLPKYYRNKIYNEEEREQLWINLLDKNERYILGQKINISKNEDSYYNLLDYARRLNKELGYGDDSKNWEKIRYENQKRNLKLKERLNNKNSY